MSRSTALARLAVAYGAHQLRRLRRGGRAGGGEAQVLATYADDRLLPLTQQERGVVAAASSCINCGLCAVVARRVTGLRPADLAPAYLRDYPVLERVTGELGTSRSLTAAESSLLREAAAACPVGVPLEGVLEMARRLASA